MLKKVWQKIKEFFKENYGSIIFAVVFIIIFNYPVNYSILASGGTIDINDRVKIENQYESKGSLNLAYVTELRGTVASYLLSYIIPTWERDSLDDYKANKNETQEDIDNRGIITLKESEQNAISNAYKAANKEFVINNDNFYVYYVYNDLKTDLKVGDKLIKIDNITVKTSDDYLDEIASKNIGDEVELVVLRDNEEVKTTMKVRDIEGEKKLGIVLMDLYDYTVSPEIKFAFKSSESGPSGGLMLSLAIYNKLVEEDITKGKKIVGTGTIDAEGNVGQIDGIRYKLKGAVSADADVFLAPAGENYEECKKYIKKYNYKIKLISVSTFDEALEELGKL